jgi:hypothetical protein
MKSGILFASLLSLFLLHSCVGGAGEQRDEPGRGGDAPSSEDNTGGVVTDPIEAPVYVPEEVTVQPIVVQPTPVPEETTPTPPVAIDKDRAPKPTPRSEASEEPIYKPMDPGRRQTTRPKPAQPGAIITETPVPISVPVPTEELATTDPVITDSSTAGIKVDSNDGKPALGGLRGATASYECERDMKLDSIHRVELVISKSLDTVMILSRAASFENPDNIEHEAIEIGDFVSAQLIDPSNGMNFQISTLSLEKQRITRRDTFSYLWQWDVRPLQTGNLPLRLKVITELEGEMRDIPVFDTQIRVQSEEVPPKPWWIIPASLAVLLGLGTLFYFKRKKQHAIATLPLPEDVVREVRALVSDGETLEALGLLETRLANTHPAILDEVLLLKANYNKTRRKLSLNQISQEAASVEYSKVHTGILEILKV